MQSTMYTVEPVSIRFSSVAQSSVLAARELAPARPPNRVHLLRRKFIPQQLRPRADAITDSRSAERTNRTPHLIRQ